MRGAVLLSTSGPRAQISNEALPPSLLAVRSEPPPRVWAPAWAAVRADGWWSPGAITLAITAVAIGTVFEALLFRSLLDFWQQLTLNGQRLAGLAMILGFLAGLLALEWSCVVGLLRLGRHMELRLRARLLETIPRLSDRYFQSRLISDMAFRAHTLQLLRQLPELVGRLGRSIALLLFTAIGIAWLYPPAAAPALLAILAAVGVPLLFQPALVERDLRFREISGSLNRFALDALLGSRAIQAHDAEATLATAQATQLQEWADAGLRQQATLVLAEAVQLALVLAPVIWLVQAQVGRRDTAGGLLLLIYWALAIPALGSEFAATAWSFPALRNTLLRFLEPIDAPRGTIGDDHPVDAQDRLATSGVKLDFQEVRVVAAGHVILDGISLAVAPGEHVAVVGASGSGKSSLVGLLLGWYQPSAGRVAVDDQTLGDAHLARLRRHTAWIDPQVHLFRGSLYRQLAIWQR